MADSPYGSRPSSRAQSDTSFQTAIAEGDRPGSSASTRTLSREVEHIKNLISRSQHANVLTQGSITAQVFRNRSSSTPVTTAYILHELDQLKRRIRYEAHQQERRPSVADPETESETEGEDVLDEREEELEKAREEVMRIKSDNEKLLEAAERKIDIASGEKEVLEGRLDKIKEQLRLEIIERQSLEDQLEETSRTIVVHNKQVQEMRGIIEEQKEHLEQLESAAQESERVNEEGRKQIIELQTLKTQIEAALVVSKDRVSALEEDRQKATDELQKAEADRAANENDLNGKLKKLHERHDSVAAELERQQMSNQDLQERLKKSDALTARMKSDHEDQCRKLAAEINEHKTLLESTLTDVKQHAADYEDLRKDRDAYRDRAAKLSEGIDDFHVQLGGALYERERLEKTCNAELEEMRQEHEEQLRKLRGEHEAAQQGLQSALAESKTRHADEVQSLETSHAESMQQVNDTHRSELATLRSGHTDDVAKLRTLHANELSSANDARHSALWEARSKNAQTMDDLRASHDSELEQMRRDSKSNAESREQEHSRILLELQQVHCEALEKTESMHEQHIESLRSGHAFDIANLRTTHEKSLQEAHAVSDQQQQQLDKVTKVSQDALTKIKIVEEENDGLKREHAKHLDRLLSQHSDALEQARKTAENQLTQLRDEHATRIAQLEVDHQALRNQDRESFNVAIAAQVEAVRKEQEQRHAALQQQHDAESGRWRAELQASQDQYREALDDHESSLLDMARRHSSEQDASQISLRQQIDELRAVHEARFSDAKADHARIVVEMEQSHRQAIEAAKDRNASLEAAQAETIGKMQGEHASQLTRIHEQHSSHVATLGAEQQRRLAAMEQALEEALLDEQQKQRSLKDSHASLLANRENITEARVSELRESHAQELADVQASLMAQLEAVRGEADNLQSHLDSGLSNQDELMKDLRSQHEDELEQLRSDYDANRIDAQSAKEAELDRFREAVETTKSDLAAATIEHEHTIGALRKAHSEELKQVQANNEHERAESLAKLRAEHHQDLLNQQREHETAWADMAAEHTREVEQLRRTADQSTADQQHKYESAFSDSKTAFAAELDKLRDEHELRLKTTQAEGSEALKQSNADYGERLATMQQQLGIMQLAHTEVLQARLAEADAKATTHILELQSQHEHGLQELKTAHEQALSATKERVERELFSAQAEHTVNINELQSSLKSQLEGAKTLHEEALATQNATWMAKMTELKAEHEESFGKTVDNSEVESRHDEALAKAVAAAQIEAQTIIATAEKQHRKTLEAAVERARQSGQAEVRNLKKRHQDAVTQIRTNAQKQSASQITELEDLHRKEMEAALQAARVTADKKVQDNTEFHQGEILRLETERISQISELRSRLQDEKARELESKQGAYQAEVAALQSRLDASLTGHAEAERSVSALRQQVSLSDQRVKQAKQVAEDQIVSLSREKDDLTSQLEKVQASLHELQSRYSGGTNTPKRRQTYEELGTVKLKLENLQEEQASMRLTIQKHIDDKSELTRQNEFLVKELEALLAQRIRPRIPSSQKSDALTQTEPLISEPKADLATLKIVKEERRKSQRPVTPLSPGMKQAKDEVDKAWQSRSFEEYLRDAQAELSELGSVITANETLFARKIQEHIGELQRAKDNLAAEYQAKLARLAEDKEQMERMVMSRHAAEFARERRELVSRYGADPNDMIAQNALLTGLPVNQARALRTAEQQLVNDYNKKIAKRKSQIALRHAEEFQNVTQEYDRKVVELLNNRSRLEGDLSVDPARFELEYSELQSRSVGLQAETPRSTREVSRQGRARQRHGEAMTAEERSRSRMSTWTSQPRTSTSIPRSSSRGSLDLRRVTPTPEPPPAVPKVPAVEDRNSPSPAVEPPATSQHRRPGSSHHPPVPQRSLLRAKNPTDHLAEQKRIVTEPISTRQPPRTPPRHSSRAAPTSISVSSETSGIDSRIYQANAAMAATVATPPEPPPSRPGILRRVKDRISMDPNRPYFPRPSSSKSNRSASRAGTFQTSQSQRRDSSPPPPIPPLDTMPRRSSSQRRQQQPSVVEKDLPQPPLPPLPPVPTTENYAVPKWIPKRSRSTKLSSGLIYYNAPRQSPNLSSDNNP